jgi:hypothetical protein
MPTMNTTRSEGMTPAEMAELVAVYERIIQSQVEIIKRLRVENRQMVERLDDLREHLNR